MNPAEGRRTDVRWYALAVFAALGYAAALTVAGHVGISRMNRDLAEVSFTAWPDPWSPFLWLGVAAAARLAVFAALGVLLARRGWGWWSAAVVAVMAAAEWVTNPAFIVNQSGFSLLERTSWENVTGPVAVAIVASLPAVGALIVGRCRTLARLPLRPVLLRSLPPALLVAFLAAQEGSLDGPRERLFSGGGAIALVVAVGMVTLSPGTWVRIGLLLGVGALGTTLAFYAENTAILSFQDVGYGLLLPLVAILGLGGWFMASPAIWRWWQRVRRLGPNLSLHHR